MKKGRFALLIIVIIVSFAGLFYYTKNKLDDEEKNKETIVNNDNDNEKQEEKSTGEPEVNAPQNNEQIESVPMKGNDDKDLWKTEAANSTVVTVIGTTWCPNCQVYEPIMQEIKDEYKLNVYFFKVDLLSQEESDDLINTFELTGYRNSIPYTAIISNGTVLANHTGRMAKEDLINFLKDNEVIK